MAGTFVFPPATCRDFASTSNIAVEVAALLEAGDLLALGGLLARAAYTGTNNPEVGAVAGRAIALFASMSGASKVETAYSADGGVTWAGVTLSSGLTVGDATRITRPIYDTNTGAWWFCLSSATSDKAEIWTSTNGGASWAIAKTFTSLDVEVQAAGMIGPVWAMLTKKGRVMPATFRGLRR